MPLYNASAFATLPEVAIPGKPAYFFGSLDTHQQDTRINVTNVALTSNVATITGTILAGNIPLVGALISIQGSTSTSGLFNVSAVPLTAVSVNASTGAGTFSFALTNANVTSAADSGTAKVVVPEIAEACANGTSVAIYVPSNELRDLGQKSITVASTFPSAPVAATVTLYSAINNDPTGVEWTSMGVVGGPGSSAPGPLNTLTVPAGRFFRVVVSGVSGGTSPTMIVKMVC
jgi:hypothetical protein